MKIHQIKINKSYLLFKKWWDNVELNNYEKSSLNQDIICFNQQLLRLKEQTIRIGVYGKSGVGKSSILNNILKKDLFETNILNGTTTKTSSIEWIPTKDIIRKVELIDTPGFDIYDAKNTSNNEFNIFSLDLILFVLAGDINRNEYKTLLKLIKNGKKIILILNKVDNLNNKDITTIKHNIKNKLPNNIHIPIIITSNNKNSFLYKKENIQDYLIQTINRIGYSLIIYNTFQLAIKLALNIKEKRLIKRKKEAQTMIGKFATFKASSVAINPLMFLDIAGSFALDTILVKELSQIYGLKIKNKSAKEIIKTISVNNISIGAAQIAINTTFNLMRKITLFSAPLTNGISLLPYGSIAMAQAIFAINSTKLIGKLAAKEILKRSKINGCDPFQTIQQIALKEPEIECSNKLFLYNQRNHYDFSIFIP